MNRYARAHVSDHSLHESALAHARHERGATADLLADLAEIDVRRFYLAMAYPSLFAYCVAELNTSEDTAYKRIKAARAARRFPAIFDAVADGRLNLSGVVLLAPHLTETTAQDLLDAATNKSNLEIEKLLALRFPRPDIPGWVGPIPTSSGTCSRQQSQEPVEAMFVPEPPPASEPGLLNAAVTLQAVRPVDLVARSIVKPLAPQRYEIHFSMSETCHRKLRYLQDLLGLGSGDLGQLFEDALDARIQEAEKQKFAATEQPRRAQHRSRNPRHVPADVKRAVWRRDGAQCTFVSETGRRCEARKGLQFDHVIEVARGGEATVDGIRLRCWAHNQYGAECTYGAEFMRHKRIAAMEGRTKAREQRAAPSGSGLLTPPAASP